MATYTRNNYVTYGEDPASSVKYNDEIDNIYTGLNDLDDKKLARDGSQAMTGDLDMDDNKILNLGNVPEKIKAFVFFMGGY